MESISELTARLNRIRWKPSRAPTPAALKLAEEHVRRERIVLEYLIRKTGKPPGEAHTASLTEGDDPAFAEAILDALSKDVDFSAAGVRESLYLTIVAYCCWNFDRELSRFENPWEPLFELMEMGYVVGFDESEDGRRVYLTLGSLRTMRKFTVY